MKIIAKLLFFVAVVATVVVSCKKDKNDETPTPSNPTSVSVPVTGTVVDVYGNALSGVTVTAGSYNTTTDYNGSFYLPNAVFSLTRFAISFEKTGYFSLYRAGVPQSGKPINMAVGLISETDMTYAAQLTFSSTQADSIVLPDGSVVSFPANAFTKIDGTSYSGNVHVKACYLDPSWNDYGMFAFGGDLYGKDLSNNDVMLNPFSGLNVVLSDDLGNKLQLDSAHNKKAMVKMQIPLSLQSDAPQNINTWEYAVSQGVNREKGDASKVGDKYQGEVAHFSFWSCETSYTGKATIYGYVKKVVGIDSVAVSGMKVRVGHQLVITDQDGKYEAKVPDNLPHIVVVPVFGTVGFNPYVFTGGLQNNQSYRVDFVVPAGNAVLLKGTVKSASGQPIPNAYVSANWYSTTQQQVVTFTNSLGKFVLPVDPTAYSVTLTAKTGTQTATKYINYPTDTSNADITMPATPGINKLTVDGTVIFNITGMPSGDDVSSYYSMQYIDIYVHVQNNGMFSIFSAATTLPPVLNQSYAVPSAYTIQYGTQQLANPDSLISGTIKFTKFGTTAGQLIEGTFTGTSSLGTTVTANFSVPCSVSKKKLHKK
jgi:hypothetical protein